MKRGKFGLQSYCRVCDIQNKKAWYKKNKKHVAYKSKTWYKENPGKYAENQRRHKEKYKEFYSEYYKRWASENRDKLNLKKHCYYARRRRQLGVVSPGIIDRLFIEQAGLCLYCNRELQEYHLEHKLPISRGGLHDDKNLCLSCPRCNLRKKDKTVEEFLKYNLRRKPKWQLT